MADVLKELTKDGVSVWLDDISRERLSTGNLATLMKDFHVRGVTSNPTIFASALAKGNAYDDQLKDLAARKVSVEESARMITTYDIRWAADVLRPAYDKTDGLDGRVSIEVDPRLANETVPTIAEAKQLWWLVDRPNMYVKIPATLEGIPAITATLAAGISVNVTLVFSLERYEAVIEAYLAGLEQAAVNGHDIATIASVASFFVSRVDTEVDKRLDAIGTDEARALKARRPSPTRGWPTSSTSRSWTPTAGARWPPRAPRCSGRCGPPPRPRTRPSPTPCTWSTWWSRTP